MSSTSTDFNIASALQLRAQQLERSLEAFLGESLPELERAAEMMCGTLRTGRTIFVCGNGGSAAQAAHIETELLVRFKRDRSPLPCLYLGTSASTGTAIANDYSFDDLFSRPLAALGRPGDLLVALSTSGTSPNVLAVLGVAKAGGIASILLTGPKQTEAADVALCLGGGSADEIQDGHQLVIHALMDAVEASVPA